MSKSNIAIAREDLADVMRSLREDREYPFSRVYVSRRSGVSHNAIKRLEHASPRQRRLEIETLLEFYKSIAKGNEVLKVSGAVKEAIHHLDICFPKDDSAVLWRIRDDGDVYSIPVSVIQKPNRRFIGREREWTRKRRTPHFSPLQSSR